MFKKFKDKLAEEMKQSPSRLQAGMQQLAQAVISPAASNNLIQDVTTSVDDLNSTIEEADPQRNISASSHFQSVDLLASNPMERSRRSSFSSVASDNFFPSYESPGNMFHLQSDMEQSASEFEDSSSSSQLEHISKEELYAGYQKLRTKYTKYRAAYRELYKENTKMKSVLVETQDKALRRIANLKEQCQLEQEAKAHLEEALRNDIEEKDHLINTLSTKIKLLQENGLSNAESLPPPRSDEHNEKSNVDLLTDSTEVVFNTNDNLIAENSTLKEKVKKFEVLLAKCNESLKKNKEKISQLTENRDILERDLNILRNSSTERTEMLEKEIYKSKSEIMSLNERVEVLKKREEDSALSLAENKLFIHRELEVKEEQNKQLQLDLKKITEYKDILAQAVVKYDHEFKRFDNLINDRSLEIDAKVSQLQDLFTNKSEAIKLIQQDVKHKFLGIQDEARVEQDKEIKQRKEISNPVRTVANESVTRNDEISRSRDELEIKNAQLLGLTTELKSCKSTINDLKEMLKETTMDSEQVKMEKECLIANILEYKKILGKLRKDCNSVKEEIKENYSGQEATIDSMRKKLQIILDLGEKPEKESPDSSSNAEASSVELKTIINENNALRKKCEQLTEQNEIMIEKAKEFDRINSTNIKLIAEIDELNFKLRDIAELQETQDKLQSEMEGLRAKLPFSNNISDNSDHFKNQVSSLKDKLDSYDVLSQDNAKLKQELIEAKNELATALDTMEILKSEQSKKLESVVENFSKKCAEYENMISSLTAKFNEQTLQLDKLNEELTKQKTNFRELNDKYEKRSTEFNETNEAFIKQASELKEFGEKYNTQCSEIESLREKETEILNQLDETVKVREEMINKFNELESCKNNIIEKKNKELEELKLRHEKMLEDLESSEEIKNESVILKTKEIELLTEEKTRLNEEIEILRIQNNVIEILRNDNAALQLEMEKLQASNIEVIKNNKELKEEQNSLVKLNTELKLSEDNLKQNNDELQRKLINLENELHQLGERLAAEKLNLEQRISELNKELENSRDEGKNLRELLDGLEIQGSEEAALRRDFESRNKELIAKINELQTKLNEFENIRQENIKLEKEVRDLSTKIQSLDDLEAKNSTLLQEIQELNHRIDESGNTETQNRLLNEEIENLKFNIAELEAEKSESTKLRNELKILSESRAECLTEVEGLHRENANFILQVEELQISINKREEELKSIEDYNKKLISELEAMSFNQLKTLEDKSKTITELEKTSKDFENKISEHLREIESLRIKNKELQNQLEKTNAENSSNLENKTTRLLELENTAEEYETKLVEHKREIDALKIINKEQEDRLRKMESNHSEASEDTRQQIAELEVRVGEFEDKFLTQRKEIDAEKDANKELQERLSTVNIEHSRELEDKAKTITELEKGAKDFENKLIGHKQEVGKLEAINKDLQQQLGNLIENKNNASESLSQSNERLQDENNELRTRLDEAVILYETKESQIDILNQELKNQTQILTDKLKTNEEEQNMRIKQLVKEFQAQIHDKDEQIQAALEKRFERQQNYESDLIQQYREQLKDFQIELTAKSEQIENLILDNKETIQAYKDQVEELTQAITEVKKEHSNEIKNIEQNWKTVLKQKTGQLETKHMDEVNELTKEWSNERKAVESSDTSQGELESTSRVAMATIQSNTGSLHSLQQTLISQKRELSELRKLLRIRNESLEGSTEIEYLRNILFEYMMGKETLVLSRVISAVVKFDQEQTNKVLKKEEDKLTLLGSLGLL